MVEGRATPALPIAPNSSFHRLRAPHANRERMCARAARQTHILLPAECQTSCHGDVIIPVRKIPDKLLVCADHTFYMLGEMCPVCLTNMDAGANSTSWSQFNFFVFRSKLPM